MEKTPFQSFAGEGSRYVGASAAAFAVDFAVYVGLIRLGGWHYLVAAPAGFALGLAMVYILSVRWVFRVRRIRDARLEFAIFAAIGLAGLAVNEAVLYGAIGRGGLSYEAGKAVSALVVFCLNFALRKLLLFTRYGTP